MANKSAMFLNRSTIIYTYSMCQTNITSKPFLGLPSYRMTHSMESSWSVTSQSLPLNPKMFLNIPSSPAVKPCNYFFFQLKKIPGYSMLRKVLYCVQFNSFSLRVAKNSCQPSNLRTEVSHQQFVLQQPDTGNVECVRALHHANFVLLRGGGWGLGVRDAKAKHHAPCILNRVKCLIGVHFAIQLTLL